MRTGNSWVGRNGLRSVWPLLLAGTAQAALLGACGGQSPGPYVDKEGTTHLPPMSIPASSFMSTDARAKLIQHFSRPAAPSAAPPSGPPDYAAMRADDERNNAPFVARAKLLYPVNIEEKVIGGVRTQVVTPQAGVAPENRDRVLINLHGGGFNSDSGSLIEGVPIANLAKMKVVSVYYRLAPENPFPAAVDDTVAVYKELLKTYKPNNIGIFGTSAGGILTAEVTVKLKQLGLPLPGALGLFTMLADFSRVGDSRQLFTLNGFPGDLKPTDPNHLPDNDYVAKTDRKDPVLSPLYADLHGFPPSLLVTSTRDILLSDTTVFHRALLRAGNDSQLLVFEALPHAFWYHFQLPETKEALEMMAKFLDEKVGR